MPLDPVGQRYANNLFTKALDSITENQNLEIMKITAEHTARRTIQSGMYFSAYAKVLSEGIRLRGEARVDTLLKAYQKSGLALDEAAIQEIKRETIEYCHNQQHHAVGAMIQK